MILFIKEIGNFPKNTEGTIEHSSENVYIVNEDESIFGVGNSIPEALGNLVLNHRDVFGAEIRFPVNNRVGNPLAEQFK